MRTVLVCGGRNYNDRAQAWRYLGNLLLHDVKIIHGAARGADSLAGEWAGFYQKPVEAFPADWDYHGLHAGIIRNKEMLAKGKPSLVIAFPGGRGTAHMVMIAQQAQVMVAQVPL